MGGMFGESKYDVLRLVPENVRPRTGLFKRTNANAAIESILTENNLNYPLIFKPDIGERGFMVRRINDATEAANYMEEMSHDFLIQEFVSLPMEFGVLYERHPSALRGRVTSVVMKEMLFVEGNGRSTLQELILSKERAKLQWPSLQSQYRNKLDRILPAGERLELVSIGNHSLGTKFINANHLITDELEKSFDRISMQIPGFFFGRFDLRCGSIEDLAKGNVVILELNGCGAEPAHMYDPEFSFFRAVGVLIRHWSTIYEISLENKRLGVDFLSLKEAVSHYQRFKKNTRSRQQS